MSADIHTLDAGQPAPPPEHLDPGLTFPGWLRRTCERYGDRPAFVFGDDVWSFTRLHDEVVRMERALLGLGAGKGTRVAVLMGARPEWVVTVFAAMGIGAIAVPLSTYEPALARHALLRHADAAILVLQDRLLKNDYLEDLLAAHPRLLEDGPLFEEDLPYLRHVIHLGDGRSGGHVIGYDDALAQAPELPPSYLAAIEADIHPTDDALVVYTSGTSGASKGVLHAHRTVAIQFDRLPREFSTRSEDVVWGTYPLFWSAGIAWVLGASLAIGAKLVLQEWFDVRQALDLIAEHRVTVAHATPLHFQQLEEALADHPVDISSLRILPRDCLTKVLPRPADAPFGGASLGLTETLTLATSEPWDGPLQLRLSTNGRPLEGTLARIIDPESGATLPVGEHGEVVLKGTTLMKGYNKRFPETYLDADGYYRTGDGGYFDEDGYLHWTGRISQLIRTNSDNVSPAEVEAALQSLDGVKFAVAVGVHDPDYDEVVAAAVVPKPGAALTQEDIRAQLKEKLASYKIPRHVLFLAEDEIEMTATGKARLTGLKELMNERLGLAEAEGGTTS
jgi:acyl-CoA synthetase (AMP-forming)/AMP-acid ligase II